MAPKRHGRCRAREANRHLGPWEGGGGGFAATAIAPAFACPLEVIGTWRLVSATEPQPMLVTFGADGWANVVSVTGTGHPEDFDTVAQVRFQLVPRRDPKRIEFQTPRGIDLFPAGTSSWAITSYTDEGFRAGAAIQKRATSRRGRGCRPTATF